MESKINDAAKWSDKTQKTLGEIPCYLQIIGWSLIAGILAALVVFVCLEEIPYTGGESILQHFILRSPQ